MTGLVELAGVAIKDVPRYLRALTRSGMGYRSHPEGWISLCNRIERLRIEEGGATCCWESGSSLHATDVLPWLGRRMLNAALAEWPIRFRSLPLLGHLPPRLSFIFTHAGGERLPQLRRTIESVFAQRDVSCEVVVVDQSQPGIRDQLPDPVRYVHLDKTLVTPGWHKSWGYNVGAHTAQADILVFQDGDVCMPERYASELSRVFEGGAIGAASIQRLLFYLDRAESDACLAGEVLPSGLTPVGVRQNWKGGTIAIRKDAFNAIGGFDEGFVDWGGEDDEFYDRCAQVGHRRSGYLPFVHLWHPPQAGRKHASNANISEVMPWRMSIARAARVAELAARRFGQIQVPDPRVAYKDRADR